nr:pseudouridine synthase [bacterium]
MRLDKMLSHAGLGSRTQVRRLIDKGRVTLDGVPLLDAGAQVEEGDDIRVDANPIGYRAQRYILYNKPAGLLTAARDPRAPTVMDALPQAFRASGVMPVGRLDKDTQGLLILTNDGELAHRLLSPKRQVWKTYEARLDGPVGQPQVEAIAAGVDLGDFTALPATLVPLEANRARIIVCEGKFHQVKRMMAAVGRQVLELKRTDIAGIQLDEALEPGGWREATRQELAILRRAAGMQVPGADGLAGP